MKNYIGLDAHSRTSTFVVLDSKGRQILHKTVASTEREILRVIDGLKGSKALVFEECHLADWLNTLLKPNVDELVICDPARISKKRGAKTDLIDAHHLAQELRAENLVGVYHNESLLELRILCSHYSNLICDIKRVKCRIKSLFNAQAVRVEGKKVYDTPSRLKELKSPSKSLAGQRLYEQLELLESSKKRYVEEFEKFHKKHTIIRRLDTIPGFDVIRSCIAFAIIGEASRFRSKHQLWSYAELVRHRQISDGLNYGERKMKGRSDLKNVFLGAAHSVVCLSKKNSLKRYYDRLRSEGKDHHRAKKAVARKIAAITLAVMKGPKHYDDLHEERSHRKTTSLPETTR